MSLLDLQGIKAPQGDKDGDCDGDDGGQSGLSLLLCGGGILP